MIAGIVVIIVQYLTADSALQQVIRHEHMIDIRAGLSSVECIVDCLRKSKICNLVVVLCTEIIQNGTPWRKRPASVPCCPQVLFLWQSCVEVADDHAWR